MSISDIFKTITPEDLITPAHIHERLLVDDPFEEFISRNINYVRYAFAAADGEVNPVVALGTTTSERLYVARDDESVSEMLRRMSTLARVTGAHRMFFQRRVATLDPWEGQMIWYAKDGPSGQERLGTLEIEDKNRLGEIVEAAGFDSKELMTGLRSVI